MSESRIVTV